MAIVSTLAVLSGGEGLAISVKAEVIDNTKFILVVDPGHGGKDAGAVDNGQKEKDINLAVGRELNQLIKKKLKNVDVVMTRDNDTYLTLQERATKANRAKGDLFISIHTNSVDKSNKNRTTVNGASVYALGLHKDDNNMEVARRENSVIELENNYTQRYSGFDPGKDESYIIFEMAQKKNLHNSLRFAKEAQKQLVNHAGRRDRGVHQAGFWVLWATSMPAVLVELDFICNPTQAAYMGSDKGVKALAESLFEAVKSYVEGYDKGGLKKNRDRKQEVVQIEEEEEVIEPASDVTAMLLPAATPQSTERKANGKVSNAATSTSSDAKRQEYAQRRRRSTSSRHKSESRDLQVADIPLHTADERLAKPVVEASEPSAPQLSAKELAKREKAERKAAEKAKKAADKAKKEAEKKKKKNFKAKRGGHFETVYKIQILASKDQLKPNNPRFRGMNPVTMFRENNFYKYTYGEFKTKAEAESLLKEVKSKIPDAFIIEATRQKE